MPEKHIVLIWYGAGHDPRILIDPNDVDRLRQYAEVREEFLTSANPIPTDEVIARSREATVILTTWGAPLYTDEVLDGLSELKLYARLGGSIREILGKSAWQRGVRVITARKVQGELVADLTMSLILAGLHRLAYYVNQQRGNQQMRSVIDPVHVPHRCLLGKRVGLVGFGAIGQSLTRMLATFGCRISAFDPYADELMVAAADVDRESSLVELCTNSDVLAVQPALTPETNGLLSVEPIRALPIGALVVNTALGQVLETIPLLERLEKGDLFFCADLLNPDTPELNKRLRHLDNVLLTPSVLSHSDGVQLMSRSVIDQILDYFADRPLREEAQLDRLAYCA